MEEQEEEAEYEAGGAERFIEESVEENRDEDIGWFISDAHVDESDYAGMRSISGLNYHGGSPPGPEVVFSQTFSLLTSMPSWRS